VSGLSKEQVQAPKNYVDFDDEPEKLKDMLKGRGVVKEKAAIEGMLQTLEKGVTADKLGSPLPYSTPGSSSRRKDDGRSHLFSRPISPFTKSRTPSTPSSPMLLPTNNRLELNHPYSLSLKCHVFPPRSGPARGVVQFRLMKGDKYAVCLQEQGLFSFAFPV